MVQYWLQNPNVLYDLVHWHCAVIASAAGPSYAPTRSLTGMAPPAAAAAPPLPGQGLFSPPSRPPRRALRRHGRRGRPAAGIASESGCLARRQRPTDLRPALRTPRMPLAVPRRRSRYMQQCCSFRPASARPTAAGRCGGCPARRMPLTRRARGSGRGGPGPQTSVARAVRGAKSLSDATTGGAVRAGCRSCTVGRVQWHWTSSAQSERAATVALSVGRGSAGQILTGPTAQKLGGSPSTKFCGYEIMEGC